MELEHFVCDCATRIENEKLQSEDVAIYAFNVSTYYDLGGAIRNEREGKLISNFVVNNYSHFT